MVQTHTVPRTNHGLVKAALTELAPRIGDPREHARWAVLHADDIDRTTGLTVESEETPGVEVARYVLGIPPTAAHQDNRSTERASISLATLMMIGAWWQNGVAR